MGTLTVPCKHCQKEVSIEAAVCPHCGAKTPAARPVSGAWAVGIFLGLLILVFIIFKAVC
jgi:hypothetical protein